MATQQQAISKIRSIEPNTHVGIIAYKGLLNGFDALASIKGELNHPYTKLANPNEYEQKLMETEPLTCSLYKGRLWGVRWRADPYDIDLSRYSAFTPPTAAGELPNAVNSTVGASGIAKHVSGVPLYTSEPMNKEPWTVTPMASSFRLKLNNNFELSGNVITYVNSIPKYNVADLYGNGGRQVTSWEGVTCTDIADGFYSTDVFLGESVSNAAADAIRHVGRSTEVYAEAGVTVRTIDVTSSKAVEINMPFILGTRRALIVFGCGNQLKVAMVYLMSEGQDCFYSVANLVADATPTPEWGWAWSPLTAYKLLRFDGLRSDKQILKAAEVDVIQMWAMSWNVLCVDSIFGHVNDLNSTFNRNFDQTGLVTATIGLEVTKIQGHLDKIEYDNYLSSGYGIHKPKSDSERALIKKTWERIPDSVSFVIANMPAKNLTVKTTRVYQEYKRKREKSCKENNFLDLWYDADKTVTWKTVDNKLTSISGFKVLSYDSAYLGNFASTTSIEPADSIDVSASYDGQNVLITTSWGESFTVPATAEAISDLFDNSINRPVRISSGKAVLESVVGASLDDFFEAQKTGGMVDGMSLSMRTVDVPMAYTWEEYAEGHTYDEKVALACQQVTDFEKFNYAIPWLVKELMGSSTMR